jgi:alpha-beta hydrolase superfamily lysophospholipase
LTLLTSESNHQVGMSNPEYQLISINGKDLCLHVWTPAIPPRALCVVYHGFLAHGLYPTVRFAAELLVETGFKVMAADLPGHGSSPGLRGYIESAESCIEDCVAIAEYAQSVNPTMDGVFLVGSSMGGTLALSVAQLVKNVQGVVLLAPMLRLSVSDIAGRLLSMLSMVGPTWQIIPSSSTNIASQYRDPQKRKECEEDTLLTKSSYIRVGSASTCVNLVKLSEQNVDKVECPILVAVADEDVVVDPQGSIAFYEACPSKDKTLKRYAALHGLLCEPAPLVDEITKDIKEWLVARV